MKGLKSKLVGPFDLHVKPLFSNDPTGQLTGIYFWVIQVENEWLINYIGMTKDSFKNRNESWVRKWKNGRNSILDINEARKGNLVMIWDTRQNKHKVEGFSQDRFLEEYQSAIQEDMELRKAFLLPFRDDFTSKEIELFECEIGRHLRDGKFGQLHDPVDRYDRWIDSEDEELSITIENHYLIAGLNEKYELTSK